MFSIYRVRLKSLYVLCTQSAPKHTVCFVYRECTETPMCFLNMISWLVPAFFSVQVTIYYKDLWHCTSSRREKQCKNLKENLANLHEVHSHCMNCTGMGLFDTPYVTSTRIWGSMRNVTYSFEIYVVMWTCGAVATFRRNILPLSAGYKTRAVVSYSTATGMLGSTG